MITTIYIKGIKKGPSCFLEVDIIQYNFVLHTRYFLQLKIFQNSFRVIRNQSWRVQKIPYERYKLKGRKKTFSLKIYLPQFFKNLIQIFTKY